MYKIILYNNGNRKKCMGSFRLYTDALNKYNKILDQNQVFFPKQYMWNGVKTDYELVLTAPNTNNKKIEHFRNEFGALVHIVPKGDFVIKKIQPYLVEEEITHKNSDTKHDFKSFIKNFILKDNTTKVITTINNKLVIEYYENDNVDLFILKNNSDSIRLNDLTSNFVQSNSLGNFMFFNEPSKDNKIRLYDKIQEQLGLDRHYLIKISTR
jgi:hypothetical protein